MRTKYVIFSACCMKGDPFSPHKREITPVKRVILESRSEMCKWSIDMKTPQNNVST